MAIDVETRLSPGWYLQRCTRKLAERQPRLRELQRRYREGGPLPELPDAASDAYRRIQSKSRTNYYELIVEALRERLHPLAFRTAAAGDVNGDAEAARVWSANALDVEFSEVLTSMFSMGDGYMLVGNNVRRDLGGVPPITNESPLQVTSIHDPVYQRRIIAGAKLFHDDETDRDMAYLYLNAELDPDGNVIEPPQVWVAGRDRKSRGAEPMFTPATWNWDDDLTGALDVMPLVRFRNREGIAEFERHIDLLDRIDHQVFQRMTIATMQAFRQRGIRGLPMHDAQGNPLKDANGQPITPAYYHELFVADPGALWALPETAEMWESGQVDLTPLLQADKDDIAKVAAVTRTPLPTLMPGDGADSAEGAAFKREGLVFRAYDRLARCNEGIKDVLSAAFTVMGETERADRGQIEVVWASPERRSLAERASAIAQIGDAIPWRTLMSDVWQATPADIERMEAERQADALRARMMAPPAPPAINVTSTPRPEPRPEPPAPTPLPPAT
jgi:hypothetical protein